MKYFLLLLSPFLMLVSCTKEKKPETPLQKQSYAYGLSAAQNMIKQQLSLDAEMVKLGLEHGVKETAPLMTATEIQAALYDLAQESERLRAEKNKVSKEESTKWFEEKLKDSNYKRAGSGFLYRAFKDGSGASPKDSSQIKVQYEGRFSSGAVFDSSKLRGHPAQLSMSGIIPGWKEALKMMKPGSHWEIILPPDLAYGATGNALIPPNSVLIFDVELIEVL